MVSIRPFIAEQSTFEPEALDAMSQAFDEVCELLQIAPDQTDQRERLAGTIIDLARSGVTNASVMRHMLIATAL